MSDIEIICRYLYGVFAVFFVALVLVPINLAVDAGKAVGQEVARVKANW